MQAIRAGANALAGPRWRRQPARDAIGVARAFEAGGGPRVELIYGPSGLLRDRLREAKRPTCSPRPILPEHPPQALVGSGHAQDMRLFARNRLCAPVRGFAVEAGNLLDVPRIPRTRLATSTPKSDPAGDYARMLFDRADAVRSGARSEQWRAATGGRQIGAGAGAEPAAMRTG